jgi:hypothetical protein
LHVVLPDGRRICVDAKPSNTIGDLKNKLVQFTGLDPKAQTMVGVDGTPLADGKTLAECLIPLGGTVYLNPVKGDLKVRDASGVEHKVAVHPYDTVASLKARLHPLLGTEDSAVVTKLYHNGAEFGAKPGEDALPLSEFGVDPASSVVYANPQSSKLQVKLPSGKVVVVEAFPSDTLSQVKARLAPLAQLPAEDLHVVWNGTKDDGTTSTPLYDDTRTLGEYGVPADAALEVTESFGVTVRLPDGSTVVLQTNPNEPLKSLKARLAKMVAIPVDLQQLYHHGTNNGNTQQLPEPVTFDLNPNPITLHL